jgi:hydroxymethylpyrimidine/phosphomethylpyrimidine kinase
MKSSTPRVLTIAGSDPTGGAGIQADLRSFYEIGVEGLSVVAALTAQDATGVRGTFPVEPKAFSLQLETVLKNYRVDGVKTGMLLTSGNVRGTADLLKRFPPPLLVVDPVILSSNNVVLLEEEARSVMVGELFPLATVVTPNLPEAQALSGIDGPGEKGEEEWLRAMCRKIHSMGPKQVIITGGHREEAPTDLLYDGNSFTTFDSPRLGLDLHGSGCRFSSALCAYLSLGFSMRKSLEKAKSYTTHAIQKGVERT